MKSDKKMLYIVIAFVCILVISIIVTAKNKDSALFAPADNPSSSSSSKESFLNTETTTKLPFEYEETKEASVNSVAEEKVTKVHTTTMPTTTKKDDSIDSKPSETSKGTTTTKVTTTTKNTAPTNTSSTKPSKVQSATEPSTETTTKKILYYYTDGTTGYTPKPGAQYYDYCWQVVPWGDSVSAEEIKEAHKKCNYCGREDCIRFWISEQECPDCGVLVPVDVCHHCS